MVALQRVAWCSGVSLSKCRPKVGPGRWLSVCTGPGFVLTPRELENSQEREGGMQMMCWLKEFVEWNLGQNDL